MRSPSPHHAFRFLLLLPPSLPLFLVIPPTSRCCCSAIGETVCTPQNAHQLLETDSQLGAATANHPFFSATVRFRTLWDTELWQRWWWNGCAHCVDCESETKRRSYCKVTGLWTRTCRDYNKVTLRDHCPTRVKLLHWRLHHPWEGSLWTGDLRITP